MWSRRAVLFITCVATLLTSAARAEDVEISEMARAYFRRGVELLEAERWAEACAAFRAAHADSPSPKILGNLGFCATQLERDGEAIAAYETYLGTVGAKSPTERAQIDKDLVELRGRVAYLELHLSPPRASIHDERAMEGTPVRNDYDVSSGVISLGLRAGRHVLTIRAADREDARLELDLAPGQKHVRRVDLGPIEPDAPPLPPPRLEPRVEAESGASWMTAVWIGAGVTLAGAIATAVVGGHAAGNKDDYEETLAAGDVPAAQELYDDGQTLNVVGDALLGVTLVAGAATGAFIILAVLEDDSDATVSLGPTHLTLRTRF